MKQYSRRALLGTAGTAGVMGFAGCLGGGSSGSSGGQRECSGEQRSVEIPPAGNPEAGVTVAAYTDFECPHCRDYIRNVYPGIEADYVEPGMIRYEHHDIPSLGEWSWKVANASLAVLEGTDTESYYTFIQDVFQYQGEYTVDTVTRVGVELGADEGTVRNAIESEPFCEQLHESRQAALDRGVEGTPTVFVNDRALEAPSADDLRGAIEDAR